MSKLLYFAVLTSVVGILIILFISENKEISLLKIDEIDESYLDHYIRTRGTSGRVGLANKLTIFDLNDGINSIKVIAFDNSTLIQDGLELEVYGLIVSYKGELEIQAEEIKII
ncbi:OB-fold nucleic acid binding domain-containing protein [Candidatus Woesearchaeota archaeon]|nr:OB-fold nucleic acid binding domain-containing protein [Candidatus Woesearchaeota archaeon]